MHDTKYSTNKAPKPLSGVPDAGILVQQPVDFYSFCRPCEMNRQEKGQDIYSFRLAGEKTAEKDPRLLQVR
jgi:hypothetical protein